MKGLFAGSNQFNVLTQLAILRSKFDVNWRKLLCNAQKRSNQLSESQLNILTPGGKEQSQFSNIFETPIMITRQTKRKANAIDIYVPSIILPISSNGKQSKLSEKLFAKRGWKLPMTPEQTTTLHDIKKARHHT